MKRHSHQIVVNFDPDAAGANAAERSIDLLLDEGMQVRIVELDGDLDPDEYCKERGADAYRERLDSAKGYFYWLADRARAKHDMRTTEGVVAVLKFLLPAVQRISRSAGAHGRSPTTWRATSAWTGAWCWISFRKAVADAARSAIERPKETIRADEKRPAERAAVRCRKAATNCRGAARISRFWTARHAADLSGHAGRACGRARRYFRRGERPAGRRPTRTCWRRSRVRTAMATISTLKRNTGGSAWRVCGAREQQQPRCRLKARIKEAGARGQFDGGPAPDAGIAAAGTSRASRRQLNDSTYQCASRRGVQ